MAIPKRTPSIDAIRQAAWEVAVLLIEHTDFTAGESDIPASADFELNAEQDGHALLPHVASGIASFNVCVDTPQPRRSSRTTLFFQDIIREEPSLRLTAVFNPMAYESLRQLQTGIRLLRAEGALTSDSLARVMRKLTPVSTFNLLVIKKSKHWSYQPLSQCH